MIDEMVLEEKINQEVSAVLPETIVSAKSFDWVDEECLAIIVKQPISDLQICGKSQLDWVKLACGKMPKVILDNFNENNILQELKPYATEKKYIIVLFGDTPLLQKNTVASALDYFSSRNLSAMKLPRGFVFSASYLLSADEIFAPVRKNIEPDQFLQVVRPEQISYAFDVISQRIKDYHKSNGVILLGENTIFIDADVEIETGVIVEPFNVIKGNSVIEEECYLKSGNIIVDTVVRKGTVVERKHLVEGKDI